MTPETPLMNWLIDTLRNSPEIVIYLALALGFLVGGVKVGKLSLGNVTGVPRAGVLIGQNKNCPALDQRYPANRRHSHFYHRG